jgi:hypothetical protein
VSVRADIRDFADAHAGREPEELAQMFLRGCRREDLLPLVIDEFKLILRDQIRMREIEALSASRPASAARSCLGDLAPLMDLPYRIGDGHPRRFGALTAQEHRVRVLMLQNTIGGLQRDVGLHERAIALIEGRGVSCLDEITTAVAA